MRGSVKRRGKRWAVVYDEGLDENNNRQQRWKGGFSAKKEASEWLTDTLGQLNAGTYVAPSKLTLGAYLSGCRRSRHRANCDRSA
jgi:hypothetical protein